MDMIMNKEKNKILKLTKSHNKPMENLTSFISARIFSKSVLQGGAIGVINAWLSSLIFSLIEVSIATIVDNRHPVGIGFSALVFSLAIMLSLFITIPTFFGGGMLAIVLGYLVKMDKKPYKKKIIAIGCFVGALWGFIISISLAWLYNFRGSWSMLLFHTGLAVILGSLAGGSTSYFLAKKL
jgi:hypothetical protein